ncbi:hypothetical protein [Candidatus Rhabdochlamydia oedothoracis]|uniref:hypothetical protein n=1 Tax=Candidatus Rhabdochlamydia oedothoracis TaxID=2720720 RepID=UPI001C64C9BD|nr:hypothetical protein [Candidatus Rhabdochlamydia oedothoracis]
MLIAYCLLLIAYCLLLIAYCLLLIAYCLLLIAYCLLLIAYWLCKRSNDLLLKNALYQSGPYKRKDMPYNKKWLHKEFEKKITVVNWKAAQRDVENFLRPKDRKFVENWNAAFFQKQIEKIELVSM